MLQQATLHNATGHFVEHTSTHFVEHTSTLQESSDRCGERIPTSSESDESGEFNLRIEPDIPGIEE